MEVRKVREQSVYRRIHRVRSTQERKTKKDEAKIHGYKTFIFLTSIICLLLPLDLTSATQRPDGGVAGEGASAREGINQQIHRMCLLRVKLMHFVNSLHNYIVTRVWPGPQATGQAILFYLYLSSEVVRNDDWTQFDLETLLFTKRP